MTRHFKVTRKGCPGHVVKVIAAKTAEEAIAVCAAAWRIHPSNLEVVK